ncbi:MAG: NFACT family protein [Clostridia bacterium]|nr:NFACT family protein [Clostridia bacterium]
MAFDACMLRAVLDEINREFPDARIEKVTQPANDEIDLLIHSGRRSSRLVFNFGPTSPRLQLSSIAKENPKQAPMFCMLLRKYLTGARITRAEQLGFDRIAIFHLSCYDELGFPTERKIVSEIMGKYANLIVLDADGKILGAAKVIDFAASTVRQVLPGMKYQIPAVAEKLLPMSIERDGFLKALAAYPAERGADRFITQTYSGVAVQIARELVYRASGAIDTPLDRVDKERFFSVLSEWSSLLKAHSYTPTAIIGADGVPTDYSYMDITYLGGAGKKTVSNSFAELFDMYFSERDRAERIKQRGRDLVNLVTGGIARAERKLALQRQSQKESEGAEEYRLAGDLITANIYRLSRGMASFECDNYYDESCPRVTVALDERLSPSQNAQRAYKRYSKLKTAGEIMKRQIELTLGELAYLKSVRGFLERAESEDDLIEIREELYAAGYAARMKGYRSSKRTPRRPLTLSTSGGYTLLVGRNNTQNDRLTFKLAERHDIWFHTKDIPGSHVIMQTGGEEPSERDYTEAAAVAAYFSQATSDTVAVDYTEVKNIKKPSGAKPGFVIYKTNFTAFVRRSLGEEIAKNG